MTRKAILWKLPSYKLTIQQFHCLLKGSKKARCKPLNVRMRQTNDSSVKALQSYRNFLRIYDLDVHRICCGSNMSYGHHNHVSLKSWIFIKHAGYLIDQVCELLAQTKFLPVRPGPD